MYCIRFIKHAEGLDDRYVTRIGARQIQTCGIWDGAVIAAPYSPIKRFSTEAAARRALQPWTLGDDLTPAAALTAEGVTRIEIIPTP